ncbi:MAG: hypothetical protein ABIR62_09465 [Dokdonella sp.]|uniref:hypothetical protein n=1 Tax=Dokdonella sp. TaxID=2291710 RepID=UPI003266FFA3
MLHDMKSPGVISTIACNALTLRLRVVFESGRVILFYRVPAGVQSMLASAPAPDSILASHVIGKYAWTEVGVPSFP